MNALAFDTLKFTKHMVAAGMPAEQAEALAEEQAHLVNDQLATKRDLKEFETSLRRDLKELETSLRRDIKEIAATTKRDIELIHRDLKELEHRLTSNILKWMFGALAGQAALIVGMIKFL